ALWSSTGTGPLLASTAAASAHTWPASPMSAHRNCAEPPVLRIASAAAAPRAWLCPTTRTSAPRLASSSAAKRPIPREAPVNSTVLPVRFQSVAGSWVQMRALGIGSGLRIAGELRNRADFHATAELEGRTSRGQRGCAVNVLGGHDGVAT